MNNIELKNQLHEIMTRDILFKDKKEDYLKGGSLLISLNLLNEKDRYNIPEIIRVYSEYRINETQKCLIIQN